jgi:hypothetical protein
MLLHEAAAPAILTVPSEFPLFQPPVFRAHTLCCAVVSTTTFTVAHTQVSLVSSALCALANASAH